MGRQQLDRQRARPDLAAARLNRDGPAQTKEELKGKMQSFMHRLGKLPEHVKAYFEHPKVAYAASQ